MSLVVRFFTVSRLPFLGWPI